MELFLLPLILACTAAFTVPIQHTTTIYKPVFQSNTIWRPTKRYGGGDWVCNMSSFDGNSSPQPSRKRRKRKDGKQFSPPPSENTESNAANGVIQSESKEISSPSPPPPVPVPATPKENVVVMQVRDIRDIVSGVASPEETPIESDEQKVDVKEELDDGDGDDDNEDDKLADDEEWEYYEEDEDGNEIVLNEQTIGPAGRVGGQQDDSIEQLLADARSMRASSPEKEGEESSVLEKVLEVVATIVTVDFFVVLALLLWFLAGIFCSYILKDDTVQIAFNMNFEGVTRPALGILMIGSAAGGK